MDSLWVKSAPEKPKFEELAGDRKTEVLIIGGGITGVLCAYYLKQEGVPFILVEAEEIGGKTTKNTTAKITLQHGLIYQKIAREYGIERAGMYYHAQKEALKEFQILCSQMDCDFQVKPAFVYSRRDRKKIEQEAKILEQIGCPFSFQTDLSLPFSVSGAIRVENQAQFHPLKFLYSVAKDLPIYENTRVLNLQGNVAHTKNGTICAKKVIVATHFPFLNRHGSYFLKQYQSRSYVLALEGADQVHGMYVDEDEKGLSFRNYRNLLLLGGGSHRTGKQGGNWEELERASGLFYPSAKEVFRWATQDCMPLDHIPYIGRYSSRTPNWYVASGFQKWGMTNAMAAARCLTQLVQGKRSQWESVFNPSRSIWHPELFSHLAETVMGFITPTRPRCPHLGCALHYNVQEHTWDCSCHGSRFTQRGDLIDNPANHGFSFR